MRHSYFLLLLMLIAFTSCHTRRKAERRREANYGHRNNPPGHKYTTQEYIDMYNRVAVREMHKYRIPASIILAQGILESNSGNSELARNANNHFGIKATKDWNGKTYYKKTDEDNSIFRKYSSAEDSYRDHSEFLTRSRYADLFRLRSHDYKGWARGLKKAGYATNPKYPELLINLIEKYELWRYD